MITRREVLAFGLAVSLFRLKSAADLHIRAPGSIDRDPPHFVADARFPDTRVAAHAAEARGATVRWLADDVTALYESLDQAWRTSPFAIAGFTTNNALFVIERLAWDLGLRTIYRGIHSRRGDRHLEPKLLGPPALVHRIADQSNQDLASALGRALADWATEIREHRQIVFTQTSTGAGDSTLVSWLLAPKHEICRRT